MTIGQGDGDGHGHGHGHGHGDGRWAMAKGQGGEGGRHTAWMTGWPGGRWSTCLEGCEEEWEAGDSGAAPGDLEELELRILLTLR